MPENETKRVEALYGPYAGTQIDIPAADADAAIADGWARDPFATPDPKAKPVEWTQEAHDKAMVAAEKAARKLRGEDEDVKAKKKSDKTADDAKKAEADKADAIRSNEVKNEAIQADTSDRGYDTRTTTPTTPTRGRPKGS